MQMKKILHTLFFALFALCLSAQSLMDLAKQAGDENAKGNYFRAIEIYNDIIAAEPNTGKWYLYRGQLYSILTDFKKAETDYSKAIELTPQYCDAYLSRAILYFTINQSERSINDYNNALRYLKDENLRVFIYNNRGNAKSLRKDLQGAYNDFQKAYQIDTKSISTLDNLGKTLNQMGRGEESLMYFKKIIELDTNNVSVHSDVAYTLLNLQRFQESIEQYDLVLAKNPDSPLALSNRGLAKMNLLDYEGALDDAARAIKLYPQSAYSFRNRGMIYVAMGKTTEGCSDFKQALHLGFSKKYDSEVDEFYKHYCSTTKF
jgi:tetratricopeptide (TPR) repeat protein